MNSARYKTLLLLLALALPLPAIAQNTLQEQRDKKRASRYFSRGEVFFDAKEYSKAAEAFTLAYETYPHASTLVNIGRCYQRAGWLPKAAETYKQYLSQTTDPPDAKDIRRRLKKILNALGEMVITCRSDAAECRIQVEGIDRGSGSVTVWVEPGRRRVAAFMQGNKIHDATVTIDAGESRVVEITPPVTAGAQVTTGADITGPQRPTKAAKAAPSEIPAGDSGEKEAGKQDGVSMSAAFWVAAGTTVAAGVVTIVFGVRLADDRERFEASDGQDLDAADDGDRDQLATNILIGVTGAAAVVAVSLAIRDIWFSDDDNETKVTVGPGLGVGLMRSF